MGKHAPLPSDPVARVAEKKRRFAAYNKAWRKRRDAAQRVRLADKYKRQRDADQAERQAELQARAAWRRAHHYDLIGL